jgi:predicted MPP superfamily phosphohydrolase
MMLALRLVFFVSTMIGVSYGLHRYLWVRLARDPAWPALVQRGLGFALVLLLLAMVAAMVLVRAGSRDAVKPLAWVAYSWMGVAFFLVVALATADAFRAALPTPADDDRRAFFARMIAGVAGFAAIAASAKAAANVRSPVRVVDVPVVLPRLQGSRPWRIAQISDVHVGPTIGREFIAGIVDRVNAQAPDIVVITGDLVDGSVASLADHVAPLGRLVATHGVYFITGNHEYYSGAAEWCAHLTSLGIRVLRNEWVAIGDDDGFTLAGVDDWTAHQFARMAPGHGHDLDAALRDAHASRPVVLLAHQPKTIREADTKGVDLQLSGHTHGGQLFPFMYLVKSQQPYVAGLSQVSERTQIYVSRGTGYWGPPMRLGAPAEITLLTLRSA